MIDEWMDGWMEDRWMIHVWMEGLKREHGDDFYRR